jgi:hypothetical protein
MSTHPRDEAPGQPATRVRSHWMTSAQGASYGVGVVIASIFAAVSYSHSGLAIQLAAVAVLVLSLEALVWVIFYLVLIRSVAVSAEGVDFIFSRRTLHVRWPDLVPPEGPPFLGVVFQYKRDGVVMERDNLAVNLAQAKAILTHPRCPRFALDPKLRASVGLASHAH